MEAGGDEASVAGNGQVRSRRGARRYWEEESGRTFFGEGVKEVNSGG